MAPRWYELGLKLLNEDQESYLDVIKKDYVNDNKQCCMEMFWYWLETHPEATWKQLIDSLRSPALELNTVAASIEIMCTYSTTNSGKKFASSVNLAFVTCMKYL